jgi:hypothetical protein
MPSPLPNHGRFNYVPITERPDYSWPGGKRLALWVAINVESFGYGLEGPTLGIAAFSCSAPLAVSMRNCKRSPAPVNSAV